MSRELLKLTADLLRHDISQSSRENLLAEIETYLAQPYDLFGNHIIEENGFDKPDQSARVAELEKEIESLVEQIKLMNDAALQAKRVPLSAELLTELAQQANKAINPYYEFARAIEAAHGITGESE